MTKGLRKWLMLAALAVSLAGATGLLPPAVQRPLDAALSGALALDPAPAPEVRPSGSW